MPQASFSFPRHLQRAVARGLCALLLLTTPGLEFWVRAADIVDPKLPGAPVPPANASVHNAPVPVLPHAATPGVTPAAPEVPPTPQPPQGGEAQSAQAARPFDGTATERTAEAEAIAIEEAALPVAPSDLKLPDADAESVSEFAAVFHGKMATTFLTRGFTQRDYYAWVRFIRFFTPQMGIKEAVRKGAAYVYGDRLESEAEYKKFEDELNASFAKLHVSNDNHGKDSALAKALVSVAEPEAESLSADEASPFQIPLAQLVPDKKKSELIGTATTLRRHDAAYYAFAMRDYSLLLGPPASEKSAMPKFLASELDIPHLSVTMHPGIGTFELVGGYRPGTVRIKTADEGRRVVAAKLAQAASTGDYNDILESGLKIYGALGLSSLIQAIQGDLDAVASDGTIDGDHRFHEAQRRLMTMAHGLQFGAASLAWQDGYLTYALKRDIWITFEELNAAPTEALEFLNDFMRRRVLVVTQKFGEPETLAPKRGGRFMLWATMNPETDPNREVLAQTLKNRWRVKYFGDLPPREMAEILEKKYGLPQMWALALVSNVHDPLRRQARDRSIGDQWRDGYEINLRQLFRVASRWKHFMERDGWTYVVEKKKDSKNREITDRYWTHGTPPINGTVPPLRGGGARGTPTGRRQLELLAREAYSIYGRMMRTDNERAGVFLNLEQAFKLKDNGVANNVNDLRVIPDKIEDLGDRIRIKDVEIPKGKGGPFVPKPNPDFYEDAGVREDLYEYAKALALGEALLLMGDSAGGKTTKLEYLFYRLNLDLYYKNLDSDTAIEEIIGGYGPGSRRGQYEFREGMLPRAMEERAGAFIDEFNLNYLVEWLNTVRDDDILYLPHRIVRGHPYLVAAANAPDPRYPGRIILSPATRSRWTEQWSPVDDSKEHLKGKMRHWLKGGTVYAALLAAGAALLHLLSTAPGGMYAFSPVPGQSLGSWTPRQSGVLYVIIGVAAACFGLRLTAGPEGISSIVVLPLLFAGLGAFIWDSKVSTLNANRPLADKNQLSLLKTLRTLKARRAEPWIDALKKIASSHSHEERLALMEKLKAVPDPDFLGVLADLAGSETTETNVRQAIALIGQAGGPAALAALDRLEPLCGGRFTGTFAAAREKAAKMTAARTLAEAIKSAGSDEELVRRAAALHAEALRLRDALAPSDAIHDKMKRDALNEALRAVENANDAASLALAVDNLDRVFKASRGASLNFALGARGFGGITWLRRGRRGMGDFTASEGAGTIIVLALIATSLWFGYPAFTNPLFMIFAVASVAFSSAYEIYKRRIRYNKPLRWRDARALRTAFQRLSARRGTAWADRHAGLQDGDRKARLDALASLADAPLPADPELAGFLTDLARAETTERNFAAAVVAAGHLGGVEPLERLLAEDPKAPIQRKALYDSALADAKKAAAAPPNEAAKIIASAKDPALWSRAATAQGNAEALLASLGRSVSERMKAQALLDKSAELDAALASVDATLIAARTYELEDVIKASRGQGMSFALGARAFGRWRDPLDTWMHLGGAVGGIAGLLAIAFGVPFLTMPRDNPDCLKPFLICLSLVLLGWGGPLARHLITRQRRLPWGDRAVLNGLWQGISARRHLGPWEVRIPLAIRGGVALRFETLRTLGGIPRLRGDADVVALLSAFARAETVEANFAEAVVSLGRVGGPVAVEALEALRKGDPHGSDRSSMYESAIAQARTVPAPASAVETDLNASRDAALLARAAAARADAETAVASLTGAINDRMTAQTLRDKNAALEAALATEDSGLIAIRLRELEDTIKASRGQSLAFALGARALGPATRVGGPERRFYRRLLRFLSANENWAPLAAVSALLSAGSLAVLICHGLGMPLPPFWITPLLGLAVLGGAGAWVSHQALLLSGHPVEPSAALEALVTMDNLSGEPALRARADLARREAVALQAQLANGSIADRFKAGALTEKIALLDDAKGNDALASRLVELQEVIAASQGGEFSSFTLAARAFGRWAPFERLRGLFQSKKKASGPDAVEDTAEPPAPSLEDILKNHKIPEAEWPLYKNKVDRVQTLMRMVGGAVSQESGLEWIPGDWWAKYHHERKATYPLEHLVTHSEEQIVGLIDHEALHQEMTVLDERFELVSKYANDPMKHLLWNGLEDPRINSRGVYRLPGAERFLHSAYDRYLPADLEQMKRGKKGKDGDEMTLQGDGASAFNADSLRFPHFEFILGANYYWRYGRLPPKFRNKSVRKIFENPENLAALREVYEDFPREMTPTYDQRLAHTLSALKSIDEKFLPLYEPLVKESEKKMASMMKGGGKKGKNQKGGGGGMPNPPQNQQKQNGKPDPKGQGGQDPKETKDQKPAKDGQGAGDKKDEKKEKEGAGDDEGEPEQKFSKKDLEKARKELEKMAQKAAKELGGQLTPSQNGKSPGKKGRKSPPSQAGKDAPVALSLEDIANTHRDQLWSEENSPYQRAYHPVAHLANPMFTHLENIFQKNARPKNVGWFRTGKLPDVKRFMRREAEGGLRDDVMLRRTQRTKRRYKVTIVVDESASAEDYRREFIQAVVLLVDSLTRLQIDVEVIGFDNAARIHKSFNEPLTPEIKDRLIADLQTFMGKGDSTHDADAVQRGLDRILLEDCDRRFMFVITDGEGNGKSHISSVLPKAEKADVYVMGVGIGAGISYVSKNYPHHVEIADIEQLPGMLKTKLEEYIAAQEGGAMGGRRALGFAAGGAAMGLAAGANAAAAMSWSFGFGGHTAGSAAKAIALSSLWTGGLAALSYGLCGAHLPILIAALLVLAAFGPLYYGRPYNAGAPGGIIAVIVGAVLNLFSSAPLIPLLSLVLFLTAGTSLLAFAMTNRPVEFAPSAAMAASRAEADALAALVEASKLSDHSPLIARAEAALAGLPEDGPLNVRMRRREILDALEALKSAVQPQESAVLADHLRSRLEDPGTPAAGARAAAAMAWSLAPSVKARLWGVAKLIGLTIYFTGAAAMGWAAAQHRFTGLTAAILLFVVGFGPLYIKRLKVLAVGLISLIGGAAVGFAPADQLSAWGAYGPIAAVGFMSALAAWQTFPPTVNFGPSAARMASKEEGAALDALAESAKVSDHSQLLARARAVLAELPEKDAINVNMRRQELLDAIGALEAAAPEAGAVLAERLRHLLEGAGVPPPGANAAATTSTAGRFSDVCKRLAALTAWFWGMEAVPWMFASHSLPHWASLILLAGEIAGSIYAWRRWKAMRPGLWISFWFGLFIFWFVPTLTNGGNVSLLQSGIIPVFMALMTEFAYWSKTPKEVVFGPSAATLDAETRAAALDSLAQSAKNPDYAPLLARARAALAASPEKGPINAAMRRQELSGAIAALERAAPEESAVLAERLNHLLEDADAPPPGARATAAMTWSPGRLLPRSRKLRYLARTALWGYLFASAFALERLAPLPPVLLFAGVILFAALFVAEHVVVLPQFGAKLGITVVAVEAIAGACLIMIFLAPASAIMSRSTIAGLGLTLLAGLLILELARPPAAPPPPPVTPSVQAQASRAEGEALDVLAKQARSGPRAYRALKASAAEALAAMPPEGPLNTRAHRRELADALAELEAAQRAEDGAAMASAAVRLREKLAVIRPPEGSPR